MGIVNVTPDSFSDGGPFAIHAPRPIGPWKWPPRGADLIDIGGESTRPYSTAVSAAEELDRVLPVLELLSGALSAMRSRSTRPRPPSLGQPSTWELKSSTTFRLSPPIRP